MYASSTLEAKVVILGSQGVGKTSLVVRYISKTFSPNSTSTIGASFMTKKLTVDHCKVRLQIWDTAGQERFRAMAPMYYRGAQAALLVYDLTSQESFAEMHSWIEELKRNMTEDLVIVVVANKLDLAQTRREVPLEQAREYVTRVLGPETPLYEVSAKDDDGTIEDIFLHLTHALVERKQYLPRDRKRQPTMTIVEDTPSNSSLCCGYL
ncbi:ras-like GTP-binding protein RYL2 [Radiomyces spectabilis]|uniref:ras-like GTP-binding protein RYL2 n=1 Tax=Radiomyces spectabilis TaxID=64574 RepID=UPI0022211038|nr:ras-like GTP-binding protein RYL2 [Radiomyces spectabilis]KAI8384519.1 ras-like GTP-binding protein RYL2 [Radiomyces spectabilis]